MNTFKALEDSTVEYSNRWLFARMARDQRIGYAFRLFGFFGVMHGCTSAHAGKHWLKNAAAKNTRRLPRKKIVKIFGTTIECFKHLEHLEIFKHLRLQNK